MKAAQNEKIWFRWKKYGLLYVQNKEQKKNAIWVLTQPLNYRHIPNVVGYTSFSGAHIPPFPPFTLSLGQCCNSKILEHTIKIGSKGFNSTNRYKV